MKKIYQIGLFTLCLIGLVTTTYAVSTVFGVYNSAAQTYINLKCKYKPLLRPVSTSLNSAPKASVDSTLCDLWERVSNLETTITTFVGTPGPIGPQGPQGEPGPAGPVGSGSLLHVYDGTGQDLGVFTGMTTRNGEDIDIFNTDHSIHFTIFYSLHNNQVSFLTENTGSTYYTTGDCSGYAYINPGSNSPFNIIKYANQYYKLLPATSLNRTFTSRSDYDSTTESITCISLTPQTYESVQLEEITLPFTLPLQSPISIH